jgi:phosphate:Na+ symporter
MQGLVQILGGLALFLFGITLLSSGMEKLAGDQIEKWLDRATSNRVTSTIFGAVATGILQSSGLLMVTMIGLINANLMSVEQSIAVMLGQEIGTTLTAQIVAFKTGDYRLLLVIVGLVFLEFFPKRDWRKFGEILTGLGIVLVGMSYMSNALDALVEIPWVASGLTAMGQQPLIGVLAGTIMTSITQSSSAVTSITVAMGMSETITLKGAVGIILGANIGSCITGLIAALRLSQTARQASFAQIMINVIGVLIFLPFIAPFASLVGHTSTALARQIANAHTIFNVAVSVLMFPFVGQIASAARALAPAKTKQEKPKVTMYIDDMQYAVPAVALREASRELFRLGEITAEMLELSRDALLEKDMASAERVLVLEDQVVDPVTEALDRFVNTLVASELSRAQQKRVFQIKSLLTDIERVGDMTEDIANYARDRAATRITFTDDAICDLRELWHCAHATYSQSLQAFRDGDQELARQVCEAENEFDRMYWTTRQMHIQRLEAGLCHSEADVIFTETLRLLERISDHADNLGVSVARSSNHASAAVTKPN